MNYTAHNLYHIYNRGNQKQDIFFTEANYIFFLQKVRKHIAPHCDILAYVLMPNHFHFLIHANSETEKTITTSQISTNVLSEGFRLMLSSYTRAINKQEGRVGNLIQQNTKSKCLTESSESNYSTTCFYYIHQNPVKAGLVTRAEDWLYSSYRDYVGFRNGTLCDQKLANSVLDISVNDSMINENTLKNIW